MGIKDFVERKRFEMEQKRKNKRLKEKLELQSLEMEAKEARVELSKLKKAEKCREKIKELNRYKARNSKLGRAVVGIGDAMDGLSKGMQGIAKAIDPPQKKKKKTGKGHDNDIFGDSFMPDLGG